MKYIIIFLIILIPSIATAFTGKGVGTEEDPYQITNILQMQEVQNDSQAFYILMNDIDASETRNWNVFDHDGDSTTPDQPVGFVSIMSFNGNFNGRGFIIKNLYINFPKNPNVGLFGDCLGSVIRKVGVENCDITGGYRVGGLCAHLSQGTIEECYTTGKITVAETFHQHEWGAAGFCGYCEMGNSRIENCYSSCTISAPSEDLDYFIASFCRGYPINSLAFKCYTTGKVISPRKACAFCPNEEANSSFWDVETTGIPDTEPYKEAKGLSTSEMMKRSTFEPYWDFEKIWYIDEDKDYPRLRAFLRDTTDIGENNCSTKEYSINAFPNPSINSIEIRYSIPRSSSISIKIYNALGVQVKELLNLSFRPAGIFKETIDAAGLPAGIYFVTLKAGRETLTEQIVVLR